MLKLANNKHVDIIFPKNMINCFIKNNFYDIKDFIMISNLRYSLQYPSNQPSFDFTHFRLSAVLIRNTYTKEKYH